MFASYYDNLKKHRMAHFGARIFVSIFAVSLFLCGARTIENLQLVSSQNNERRHAAETLAQVRYRIESALNQYLSLTIGLHAYVSAQHDSQRNIGSRDFLTFSQTLATGRAALKSLQLAPDGVVLHVYPLAGNAAAIGHDILRDPANRGAALRTIETRTMIVGGPYNLKQGGLGLIARSPIFLDGNRFWGFATIVLDFPALIESAGLNADDAGLQIALRGKDGKGKQGDVIWGDPLTFGVSNVTADVSLPNGSWQLAAVPKAGWSNRWPLQDIFRISIVLIALFIAGISWHLVIQAQRLRASKQLAEDASKSKSQFLANMSHEIRTPMNAILGMLGLLRRTELTVRQADYAGKAERAARSLLGLLNEILDFSKIEAGKMTLEPQVFRVDHLLRDLSVILSASVGQKPVEVLFDIDPALPRQLVGDAMRLHQVLINLSGNAIKFTSEGEVVVSFSVVRSEAAAVTVEIAVRDTGIGIAPENQARIFSGFTQAEASTMVATKYRESRQGCFRSKR